MNNDIRKYSREWFAGNNGMQDKQKKALNNLKNGCDKEADLFSILNKKTFIGEKEEVKQNFFNRKGLEFSNENSLIYKYGGIDSLFDLIDADGDGTVTEDEVNDILSIDTNEFEKENQVFSTRDLRAIYENAIGSEDAEVETSDTFDRYKYKDGMLTEIYKDENGKIVSKYIEKNIDNNERKGSQYFYETEVQYDVIKDEKGRPRYAEVYSHKSKAENSKTVTHYIDDEDKKIVTKETVGRTIVETYKKDSLVEKNQTLKYNSDGNIEESYQQSIGDCWLLAGVNALNDTPKGKQYIKDAIKQNPDGSVTVELKGVNRKYTYSPEEIGAGQYSAKNKIYAIGDIDMNLIEMAVGDYRKELLSNPENAEKTELSDASVEDPLEGGYPWSAIKYLTGKNSSLKFNEKDMVEALKNKQKSDNRYVLTVDFKEPDENIGEIYVRHAYSINRVTKDNVYVVNPFDSSEEIEYPKTKFLSNASRISIMDLNK